MVSTILPVYNRPDMLREAVASVLAQSYRPIEIIISDDGSTDGAGAAADELAGKHPEEIRAVHNRNQGAGPAREAGRRIARGEFVQYLDSDDLLWPRKFELQVNVLRQNPKIGAVYGHIRLCRDGEEPCSKPHKWSGREIRHLFPALLVDRWWNTDCPLWRRDVCDRIGPWSDLRYSQDWEYDARAGALGIELGYVPEFVCDQRHHAGPRQTGHGKWLEPDRRVDFFRTLHDCALKAGVAEDAAEMMHFSRWVFAQARQCGELGHSQAADDLFSLARASAQNRNSMEFRMFAIVSKIFGWKLLGRLTSSVERFRGRKSGGQTLRQSWMN